MCLTRNRRMWLPQAIRCFESQSYENKSMLILQDGGEDVSDLVPDDPRIRLVKVAEDQRPAHFGGKRNLACSLMDTDIICVFDDDDHSEPGRIARHVQRLQETGASLTGFSEMKFTDGANWWQYRGGPHFALATSLTFRRDWWARNKFPEREDDAADTLFLSPALWQKTFAPDHDMDLMFARIHSQNTSPKIIQLGYSWIELPGFQWKEAA
jgi:glycosyltransferase involved in cell wall biosynthesis